MIHFKDNKSKSALSTRWAQMSKQEQIIEKKKIEIQAKLEAQKQAAALAAHAKINKPSTAVEEKNSANIFSNDGSFLSQYQALLEKQKEQQEKEELEKQKQEETKANDIKIKKQEELLPNTEENVFERENTYGHNERTKSGDRGSRDRHRHWNERGGICGDSPMIPVVEDRKMGPEKSIPALMQLPIRVPDNMPDSGHWNMSSVHGSDDENEADDDTEILRSGPLMPHPMWDGNSGPNMIPPNMGPRPMMGPGLNMPPMPPGASNIPPMPPGLPNMPIMRPGGPNMPPMPPGGPNMQLMPPGGPNMLPMPPGGPNMPLIAPGGPNMPSMPPGGPNMPPMPPGGPNMPPMPPGGPNMPPGGPNMPPGGPNMSPGGPNMPPGGPNMPPGGPNMPPMRPGGPMPPFMGPPNFPMPPSWGPNGPGPCGPGPMPPNLCGPNMSGPNGPMPPFFGPPFPNPMMGPNGPPNPMMPPNTMNNSNMPFMPRPPFGPNGPNFGNGNGPPNMPPFMPPGMPPNMPRPGNHDQKPMDNLPAIESRKNPPLPLPPLPESIDMEEKRGPPNSMQVVTDLPPAVRRAAVEVATNGEHWENVLKAIQDQTMWFLHNPNSSEYKAYRDLVDKHRSEKKVEVKPEDKYEPEFCLDDDSNDDKADARAGYDGIKSSPWSQNQSEMKREASSQSDEESDSKREQRRRKKKSRWSDEPPLPDIKPPGVIAPLPGIAGPTLAKIKEEGLKISTVNRSNQALMQYAMTNYGTTNLSDEDWKKCEDNFKLNLLYQDMLKKRQEVERLAAAGQHKYEYDSDEDTTDGTWEHKLRLKEMSATEKWATELTKQAAGKHHIGDFLPPEELKKFMEKYSAVKTGKEPDLSDYKEFKLKEDNLGFKMLQKLGWNEGQGLGAEGTGIVEPINKANQPVANMGLGASASDIVSPDDDEFDAYRKRMMLAYRFRPNPLNNPRRPYY